MSWFLNRYVCPACNSYWEDEWSAKSDDSCPECLCSDVSPVASDDLSIVVKNDKFGNSVVLVSAESADESACYVPLLSIPKNVSSELSKAMATYLGSS